jgi:regulatory protein
VARHGSARIRQELNANGIDPADHQEALDALKDSELSRAQAVWSRRYDSAPADLNERARQTRFLLARGFSSAIVRQVLQAASHPDRDAL